jgi:hypothetical protein
MGGDSGTDLEGIIRMTINTVMTESGYARKELDTYWTQAYCTQWMLDAGLVRERRKSVTWEPCAGIGSIAHILKKGGHDVLATDIHDHGFKELDGIQDFLSVNHVDPAIDLIFTNPPYEISGVPGVPDCTALDFVVHALKLMKPVKGSVIMLLRNEFDCASTRKHLFEQPPFTAKFVLTRRPNWIPENMRRPDKDNGPRHNYSWFMWNWNNEDMDANVYYLPMTTPTSVLLEL